MTDLPLLNFEQALRGVAACVRAQRTCALVGSPGGGKTSVWRAVAQHFRLHEAILSTPAYEAVDIVGTPYVAEGEFRRALDPRIAPACEEPTLLVFDDATLAPRSVEAALLRVVLDRSTGTFDLHPQTRVGLAFNPVDQTPGGSVFSAAMVARVVQLHVAVSLEETLAYFRGEPVCVPADVVLDETAYVDQRAREHADFARLLKTHPDLLQPDPPTRSLRESLPFGSARAWEIGLDAFAAHGGHPDLVGQALLAGAVGTDLATAFLAHRSRAGELPSDVEIVTSPTSARVPSGAAEIGVLDVVRRAARLDVWATWVYAERLSPEIAAAAAQILIPLPAKGKSAHAVEGRRASQRLMGRVGSRLT